jgi:hypothetical protein
MALTLDKEKPAGKDAPPDAPAEGDADHQAIRKAAGAIAETVIPVTRTAKEAV